MAVLKSRRGESVVQYMDTARELEIYTLSQCLKFPKRLTFYLTQEIVRLSQSVYNHAKSANSIFPTCKQDYELRRYHITEANNSLQCLISQLDIAKGLLTEVKSTVWVEWMAIAAREARLLAGIKQADRKNYGELT